MAKDVYDINSITSLSTLEGFRQRPQMYVGSNDIEGTYQALKEIINNATDESLMGYGDKIVITVDEQKNEISVLDEGRGVPFGIRENGENVLISIYTGLHVGGKFNHKAYANSAGCNGCGGSAVCAMSEYFTVESYKDGKAARADFVKGENKSYAEFQTKHKNGTYVLFKPDKEVFSLGEIGYTYKRVCQEIENIAYLNKGVHFIIKNLNTNEQVEYYSKNGIADFIKNKITKPLMKQPILATAKDETDEVEIAFMWSNDPSQSYVFANGLYCPEGGSPITGAKTSLTTQMKKLSKKDFDGDLIRRGLVYAINCKVQEPSFANQTKSKINNPNLRALASQAFKEGLEQLAATPDFDVIVSLLEKTQQAERAANRARQQVLNSEKEVQSMRSKKGLVLKKLSDAKKLGLNAHLLICEGQSARGSAEKGRDKDNHGIFEARGKMINPLTSTEEKYLENEEIKLLQVAMGFDYNKPLNEKKLRYGYIDFFVDPDVDGAHIFLLGLLNIWHICPEFVKQNRVGWYHAPLFIVEHKGKKTYFYSDEDYNQRGRQLPGVVRRVKGIGLLEKDELRDAIFTSPIAHEIFQYTPEAMEVLEAFMGEDVQPKKDYVFSHIDFSEYGEM